MKMLFVGVFDKLGRSTNVSQILALKKIGCEVYGYNFKQKELQIGSAERDKPLVCGGWTHCQHWDNIQRYLKRVAK